VPRPLARDQKMPAFLVSIFTVLMLVVGSCSSQPTAPPKTWSIKFTTSGGFSGLGRGNMSITSDNKFECTQTTPQKVRKSVAGGLHSTRFNPIRDAVAQLDPKGWNKPGLNVSAADAFGYNLEFRDGTENQKVFTVQWYDNTADQLPDDLKKISDVLLQTMSTSCGGTL
jgi:hypothetical protein